ncbi:MAG: ABC transporter ATP-binding protein [Betaproteobacteria bacterium]|nr:ABC transporter ATP-binding protein [Betaproteobacteria bacterium]
MLELTDVRKSFGERLLFSTVSLSMSAGDYIAIVGDSGSGKSTLLNLVAGLEPLDCGSIRFDGRELVGLDDDALTLLRRDSVGFVFQAFHVLPHLDVAQNVGLPLALRQVPRVEAAARAAAAVAAVGLQGRETSMPRELSGGELQRVAIARALVGNPRLVLADEPTGNLDPDNARQVLELFRVQVKERGAAAILVTHSEATASTADRRYRLTRNGLAQIP